MYPIQVTEGFSAHRHQTAGSAPFVKDQESQPDFRLAAHGSIAILFPLNDRAEDWIVDNVSPDRMGWGLKGIAIEARFVADIVRGIQESGYAVEA